MRLDVKKTYKLYIGGAFPRSESGRTYEVFDKNNIIEAKVFLDEIDKCVIKPDGLTGGKGVKVQGDHFNTKDDVF